MVLTACNNIYSDKNWLCRPETILESSGSTAETRNRTLGVIVRPLHVEWRSPLYHATDIRLL